MARKITKATIGENNKPTSGKKQVSNLPKLKMLITVIDRSKTLFYMDLLEQFEVNIQMVLYGRGTADSQMLQLLGLAESDKSVILSYIREDRVKDAMDTLEEKFHKVKNGKGIAYTVSLDSMIGAHRAHPHGKTTEIFAKIDNSRKAFGASLVE